MRPIYYTLPGNKRLMIVPDTLAHLDGHEVITHTYSIYVDKGDGNPRSLSKKEDALHLDNNADPDYYGVITFEKPGSLFTYTADGLLELSSEESTEVIEYLSHFRDEGEWKTSLKP